MKTHNSQGELTSYGFSCGMIQKSYGVTLFKEHGVCHLIYWTRKKEDVEERAWMSFISIKEARIAYNAAVNYYCLPNQRII